MDVEKRAVLPGRPLPPRADRPARHRPPRRQRRGARAHPARPTGRRSTTAPTGWSATCGSPPTTTWCACTTAGSNRTSNGAGVVSALELATLEEFDWASWKTRRPARRHRVARSSDPERGHLLTLRRLLDTLVDTRQEVVTLIETKHPTRHGNDVEKTLVQVLRGVRPRPTATSRGGRTCG